MDNETVRIELNSAGIRELLRSKPIVDACKKQAQRIKKVAGKGFEVHPREYPERDGYAVSAESKEAFIKVYKDNVLLKALGKSE